MTTPGADVWCLDDMEAAAAAALPADVWDFLAGGSGGEQTLAANRAALDRRYVVPRVLRDVSECTTAATLLGRPVSMPVAAAPVAFQRLFHAEGELAAARAAKICGVPFTVSTMSSVALDEIVGAGGAVWLQLYWLRDEGRTFALVRRAEEAGCEAIMLTVDLPWMGRRLRDVRNRFTLPDTVRAVNVDPVARARPAGALPAGEWAAGRSAVAAHADLAISSSVTWREVAALRERTRLPLILKGVLAPEDAARAADLGVDAIVVSNHGGRQLDGAVPAIDALEDVCGAVGGRVEVLVDGAVRSGIDVLRALATGAAGVLVGRSLMWGLAAGGTDGACRVLELLATELRDALGLAGCGTVDAARSLRTRVGPPRAGTGGL